MYDRIKQQIPAIVALLIGFGVATFLVGKNEPQRDMRMEMRENKTTSTAPSSGATMTTPTTHTHKMIEVDPSLPVPSVELTISPDALDGYNLHLVTENFTFTPEAAGREPVANTGHAHLYVNDVKVARIYGNWFYLSPTLLTPGENYVMVTLNANEHSDWVSKGNHIGAMGLITR